MLKAYFWLVLIVMISVTVWASLDSNVITGFQYLFQNRWGVATLFDTYFGFFTIYLWMARQVPSFSKRVAWFLAVALFGTIAISIFMLHDLVLKRESHEAT